MKRFLYKLIFFKFLRWKIIGDGSPEIKKSIFIIVPHTSWHDFYIGLLARGILGYQISFVAKKELFIFPFGYYFRWMGGTPLDRSGNKKLVSSIVEIFNKKETFRLAIAPEGTRKKVENLKTGFYFIAVQVNIPIIPIAFDYKNKCVRLYPPFYPTGQIAIDLPQIEHYFDNISGKYPQKSYGIPAKFTLD